MALSTAVKNSANAILRHANARIDSLTAERAELERLRHLDESGQFERPVYPVPRCFQYMDCAPLLDEIAKHSARFAEFSAASPDSKTFTFQNGFFTSPDAEVLYAAIRLWQPQIFLEVGSGNSTKLARRAIADGQLSTKIISVDPSPRADISEVSDVFLRTPVEFLDPAELAAKLHAGDILFIDSSHMLQPCGDVAFLYLRLLPLLEAGVLVHIHDFFSPYEYPREWIVHERWPWNEQYLVHAMLSFGEEFQVLWPGYYLQQTRRDFVTLFPHAKGHRASSLWLRKASDGSRA